jgi:hypothetical protein
MDAMDENQDAGMSQLPNNEPYLSPAPPPIGARPGRPFFYWLRKFFACNPFYLVSAALLLYGLYLVSADATFLSREISQLIFNFGSLQFYEILLVVTAIALARRQIWYDSVLLMGVENLLVLVPFILISQAALLNERMVWIIGVAGGLAALGRFWGLKQFLKELNLPRSICLCGVILLVINVALPLVFHHLNEFKVGTKPTDGNAYETNRYSWLVLLPAMFALINVPRVRHTGELLPQRHWLPMGFLGLWLVASAVHLYSLSFVYNFDWENSFAFPLLWVVLWSAHLRHQDFLPKPGLAKALLVPPLLLVLCALPKAENSVFITLSLANVAVYLLVLRKRRDNRLAWHLVLLSCATLAAGLLKATGTAWLGAYTAEKVLLLSAAGYALGWVMRSRDPKVGLLGALNLGIGLMLLSNHGDGVIFALQATLVFLLLHSLRWEDAAHPGAVGFRIFVCCFWIGVAWLLLHSGWSYALPLNCAMSAVLLAGVVVKKFFGGGWQPLVVPASAAFVLLLKPEGTLTARVQMMPTPLLVVISSFVLFGLGTLAALTKSKWNPARAVAPVPTNSTNPTQP